MADALTLPFVSGFPAVPIARRGGLQGMPRRFCGE
jgi:hypothetical protein